MLNFIPLGHVMNPLKCFVHKMQYVMLNFIDKGHFIHTSKYFVQEM